MKLSKQINSNKKKKSKEINRLFLQKSKEIYPYSLRCTDQQAATHPVGEKDAVEVVGFVLEDDGGEAADGISDRFESIDVNITDDHSLRTLHIPVYVRYGQAAFRTGLRLFRPVYYTDIRIYLERLSLLVESLDSHDPPFKAYLRSGDAYSVLSGIRNRSHHPVGKPVETL